MKRLLKNEKGLTLIELLAVVVILGIIAAIAIPAIGKIIDDSRDKAAVSDALQIINAAKIAKAANPKGNIFVVKENPDQNEINLKPYLDSEVDDGVTVTFNNNEWEISGHNELSEVDGFDDTATEKELTEFLETGNTPSD